MCRGKRRLGKALLYGSRGKHYAPVSSPGILSPPPTAESERRDRPGEKGEGRLYSISSRLPSETRTRCLLLLAPSHTTGTPKKAGKTKRNRVRSRRHAHAAGAVRFLGQLSLRAHRKARCCGGRREQDGPSNIAFHLWITPPPARLCPRGVLLRKGSTGNSNNIGRAWQGSRHRGDAARAASKRKEKKKQGSRGRKRVQLPDGKQRRDAEKWNGKSRNGRTGRADTIRERKTRARASLTLSHLPLASRTGYLHSPTPNTDREHEHKSRPVDTAWSVQEAIQKHRLAKTLRINKPSYRLVNTEISLA